MYPDRIVRIDASGDKYAMQDIVRNKNGKKSSGKTAFAMNEILENALKTGNIAGAT